MTMCAIPVVVGTDTVAPTYDNFGAKISTVPGKGRPSRVRQLSVVWRREHPVLCDNVPGSAWSP